MTKHNGAKTLRLGNETFNLKMSFSASCKFEEESGQTFGAFLDEVQGWAENPQNMSMIKMRMFFWALFINDKPDVTIEEVMALLDLYEGDIFELIVEVINAAFGDATPGDAPGK